MFRRLSGQNPNGEYEHRQVLPQISSLDTSKVELSMDPVMHGETREERWGSLYTAHADFMNGWTEDGAQFMTDLCMNQGLDCGTTVPYAYSKAEENTGKQRRRQTSCQRRYLVRTG